MTATGSLTEQTGIKPAAPPMWVVAIAVGSSIMGITLLTPALPLMQDEFNASSDAVQLLLTFYLIALAAGQLIYGTLSDRTGRRPLLLFGAFLFGLGGALGLTASSIEWLTFYRIIQGLGAAACLSMGRTMINDCFDRFEASKHLATLQIMVAVAPIMSLALGGVLAQLSGWQGAFQVTAATGFLVFLAALLKTRETHLHRGNSKSVVRVYRTVLGNPLFNAFAVTGSLQVAMFFSMNGFLPYQYERLGYSPMEFGAWFSLTSVAYLLGNTANRLYFVSRGIERAAMIGCCFCFVAVSAMFITQAMELTHALSLVIPCCLFGFSNGIIIANACPVLCPQRVKMPALVRVWQVQCKWPRELCSGQQLLR